MARLPLSSEKGAAEQPPFFSFVESKETKLFEQQAATRGFKPA
jgi:hypothetical protein